MASIQIDQHMTDQMVEKAILLCANDRFDGNTQSAIQALRQGRCEVCSVFSDHLVSQLGSYLGEVDRTVKAVYKCEPYHNGSEDKNEPSEDPKTGINLVAWVERKSAALHALSTTLEKVLSRSKQRVGCKKATSVCHTLEVAMIDDRDIRDQRGYGLFVNCQKIRSALIWQRRSMPEDSAAVTTTTQPKSIHVEPSYLDPDLTPEHLIIERALEIERVPAHLRADREHHLTAAKIALIRRMISDQKAYLDVAKRWFTIADLADIYRRRIGFGKIGGKSAGMLLAARILSEVADQDLKDCLQLPESYFMGSDLIYIFMAMNGLMHWNDQKYKPEEQIRAEYPQIQNEFLDGKFPPEILDALAQILRELGRQPLIVRSSSQLEDNFGTSFAGKYNSYFCPNQGTPQENLEALTQAITRTYASTLKPEALLYRRNKDLQDYDERMAILIQVVQGEKFGRYFLPHGAGVAFSKNLYRWSPQIKREDGFARLVWGLGTRAVERVGDDYPRLVALSHPTLQPDDSTEAIRRYSQRYVDVIDLNANAFKSLPICEVLTPLYPPLRMIAQLEKDGFFITPRMRVAQNELPDLALTFDALLRRTNFPSLLSRMLRHLEEHYHNTVDVEFTLHIHEANTLQPQATISLLQCRPQSHLVDTQTAQLPEDLPPEDILFATRLMVPHGYLSDIGYVIFVSPEAYYALPTLEARRQVGSTVSQLNGRLGKKRYICIGPGRWGSTNLDLGVFVSYADIHNAGALVELSGKGMGPGPEPSLGTHFFQDLMEANIYPLAISLDDQEATFNRDFFYMTPNRLCEWLKVDPLIGDCVRLIDIARSRPGYHLELVMDDERGWGTAYLVSDS